jgi:hypothetical protein
VEGKLGNGLDGAGEIQTEAEWFNKDRIFSPHDNVYLLGLYNLSRYEKDEICLNVSWERAMIKPCWDVTSLSEGIFFQGAQS